jgi:D-hydroxyproline dehydrogenase subunit gamma
VETVIISIDGVETRVPHDQSLAAALFNAGHTATRRSVSGEPRGPLCGMGICFECRVTIDGISHRRACLEPVRQGMTVVLDG